MSKILEGHGARFFVAAAVLLAATCLMIASSASAKSTLELAHQGQAVAPNTTLEAVWLAAFEGFACEEEGSLTLTSNGPKKVIAKGALAKPTCEGAGISDSGQIEAVEIKAGGKATVKLSSPLIFELEQGPCVYEVKKISGTIEGDEATVYSESTAKLDKAKSSSTKYACAKKSIVFESISLFLENEELEVKEG